MEIDTSLPSRWNVIRRNKRAYNDPWSHHRFGTISRSGSGTQKLQNNYIPPSNTFNINTKTLPTNDDDEYISDDGQTLGSNDSIARKSDEESEYSDDAEFINNAPTVHDNDHDMSIKCAEITSEDNNKYISETDITNHTDWVANDNSNSNNDMFNKQNIITTNVSSNNSNYATDNYNYTDWIASNDMETDNGDMFENDEFYQVITEKDIANDAKADKENEEYANRMDLSEEQKNVKYKGHAHLREIRRYQKGYGLLISKEEFVSFIGNIMYNNQGTIPLELSTIQPLQEEAEAYMIELFEDAQLFAIHAGRVSVNECDIKAVLKLRQNYLENLKWLNMIIAKFSD